MLFLYCSSQRSYERGRQYLSHEPNYLDIYNELIMFFKPNIQQFQTREGLNCVIGLFDRSGPAATLRQRCPSFEADVHLTKPACHIQSPLHGEWTTSVTTAGISKWIGHTIRRLHSYSWFKFGEQIPTGSDCRAHQKVSSFKGRDQYAIISSKWAK